MSQSPGHQWLGRQCRLRAGPGDAAQEVGAEGPGTGEGWHAGRRPPHGSVGAACPPWAFGPGCSEECRCEQRNTRACDRRDGSCSCKAGFRGKRCEDGECRGAGGRAPGPAEPCRPFSPRPLQSASRAPLGWGAGRRAPALWAQPVTPSAVSVGSSVRLATAGRTVTKVSDGLCVQDLGRVQVVGFMMGTGHRKLQAGGQVSPAAWPGGHL